MLDVDMFGCLKDEWVLIVDFDSVISSAEDGGAEADEGASLLNGNLPVVAHTHGYFLKVGLVGKPSLFQFNVDVMQVFEFTSHLQHVVGIGGHTHDADNTDIVKLGVVLQQFFGFTGVESELGFLGGDMELEEAVDDAVVLGGFLVYGLQQREGVDAVDERDVGDNVLDFIGLEVSDEMPLDVLGELGMLVAHFEGFVFAEEALPKVVGVGYHLDGLGLGYGDKADGVGDEGLDGL